MFNTKSGSGGFLYKKYMIEWQSWFHDFPFDYIFCICFDDKTKIKIFNSMRILNSRYILLLNKTKNTCVNRVFDLPPAGSRLAMLRQWMGYWLCQKTSKSIYNVNYDSIEKYSDSDGCWRDSACVQNEERNSNKINQEKLKQKQHKSNTKQTWYIRMNFVWWIN